MSIFFIVKTDRDDGGRCEGRMSTGTDRDDGGKKWR